MTVKFPAVNIERRAARQAYGERGTPIATPVERVHHIVAGALAGRRIVILSGGGAIPGDGQLLKEVKAIHAGGGSGAIMGRTAFPQHNGEPIHLRGAAVAIDGSTTARPGPGNALR